MTAPVPAPDRDRETRLAEAREERVAHWLAFEYGELLPDASDGYWRFQARDLLRAAGEGDALRRDLAALADQFDADAEVREVRATTYPPSGPWALEHNRLAVRADTYRRAAAAVRHLLDGGEGGR